MGPGQLPDRTSASGISSEGVYIIYQRGEGDRLGRSGLSTLQLLSVFIASDAWAFRPQHSDFKIGHVDSDTGGEWGYYYDLKNFLLTREDPVRSHSCKC